MPRVTYTDPNGSAQTIDGDAGVSVMDVALKNGVRGIVAECGGALNCASCHVYVDEAWLDRTGLASEEEDEMLEGALAERLPNSRLSCQIILGPDLDGLQVTVAPQQL